MQSTLTAILLLTGHCALASGSPTIPPGQTIQGDSLTFFNRFRDQIWCAWGDGQACKAPLERQGRSLARALSLYLGWNLEDASNCYKGNRMACNSLGSLYISPSTSNPFQPKGNGDGPRQLTSHQGESSVPLPIAYNLSEPQVIPATYKLLKRSHQGNVTGFVCSQKKVSSVGRHSEIGYDPSNESHAYSSEPMEVSDETCLQWLSTKTYVDSQGQEHELRLDATNVIRHSAPWPADWCIDTTENRLPGLSCWDSKQRVEIHILIKRVTLAYQREEVQVPLSGDVASCKLRSGSCHIGSETYLWKDPPHLCSLSWIRTIRGCSYPDQGRIIFESTDGSLLRIVVNKVVPTSSCGNNLHATDQAGLWLSPVEETESLAVPNQFGSLLQGLFHPHESFLQAWRTAYSDQLAIRANSDKEQTRLALYQLWIEVQHMFPQLKTLESEFPFLRVVLPAFFHVMTSNMETMSPATPLPVGIPNLLFMASNIMRRVSEPGFNDPFAAYDVPNPSLTIPKEG